MNIIPDVTYIVFFVYLFTFSWLYRDRDRE